ncbi:E3 ubiquitin-protein ligase SIAH1B [Cryptotermes secundus]|uniref:E3 ubiquitin-protein ligase n=2 Tax=Cryptotermes secundus TaxID=105785 RepID=A0A2J7QTD9_9NEOP|nr:E3 ubiquitin-protein ligase SIAH1B [Cryptotermes secundus]
MATVQEDLASEFQCPVCCNYIQTPILQCPNGHVICTNCRLKFTCCPICRARLGNSRNLLVEKITRTLKLPCNYSTSGCAVALLHTERRAHEETCEFRPCPCPFPEDGCKWQGSLEDVAPHLKKSHRFIGDIEDKVFHLSISEINEPRPAVWFHMLSRFGYNFIVVFCKPNAVDGREQYFVTIQLIGSRTQSENFTYRLELKGQRRRLLWEATTRSIQEGDFSTIMNSDCLLLNLCTVKEFADNGKLSFDVSISMV